MPITENGSIYYSMPQKIKKLISFEFCKMFIHELHMISGLSINDFDYESVSYMEGTGGWNEALTTVCRKLKLNDVVTYYYTLPWYDSDLFDSELTSLLISYKLLLPETEIDEISRQLEIPSEEIGLCNNCNKIYLKKDMITLDENDEEVFMSMYKCNKCSKNEKIKPLMLNKKKAIEEVLGVNKTDYFYCYKCKKYHYNFNKGNKYCMYCEVQQVSENKNANNYYQETIKINDKYVRSFLAKTLRDEKTNSEAKVIYNSELDIFEGRITMYKGKTVTSNYTFSSYELFDMWEEFRNKLKMIL